MPFWILDFGFWQCLVGNSLPDVRGTAPEGILEVLPVGSLSNSNVPGLSSIGIIFDRSKNAGN